MARQIINETFALQLPDSFAPLAAEELRAMGGNGGDPFRFGARDAENHVVLLALWKQYPALMSWALDLKSVAQKNEQLTRSLHQGSGYRLLEFLSLQAGEEKAEVYRFSYEREGVTQVSTNLLLRDGRTVYSLIFVGRQENLDADRAMIARVMESLEYV